MSEDRMRTEAARERARVMAELTASERALEARLEATLAEMDEKLRDSQEVAAESTRIDRARIQEEFERRTREEVASRLETMEAEHAAAMEAVRVEAVASEAAMLARKIGEARAAPPPPPRRPEAASKGAVAKSRGEAGGEMSSIAQELLRAKTLAAKTAIAEASTLRTRLKQVEAGEEREVAALVARDRARQAKMQTWETMAASIAASVDQTTQANERRMALAREEHERRLSEHLEVARVGHEEALVEMRREHEEALRELEGTSST